MFRSALIAASAFSLTGCATPTFAEYVEGANQLDPDCFKSVHVQVTPMLIFGWSVPVLSGSYEKVCHPELRQPAAAGAPIGG